MIERSYVDKVLSANPFIHEAHKRFFRAGYKFSVTSLAFQGMDEPQKYTGQTLKDSHQHLHITQKRMESIDSNFSR